MEQVSPAVADFNIGEISVELVHPDGKQAATCIVLEFPGGRILSADTIAFLQEHYCSEIVPRWAEPPLASLSAAAVQEIDLLGLYASAAARSGVNGIFCLSCAEPQKEKVKGKSAPKFYVQHFRPKDIATLVTEAKNRSEYANVYFDQNLRRVGIPSETRGKLEDITACLALVVEEDADQKKFLEMPDGIRPTAIVRTSAVPAENTHLHFVFDRALPTQEAADLQELAYRKMGGDSGNRDCTKAWRVPGTKNHPDWRKIARGRPSIPQAVDTIGGTGETIDPDDLRRALEAMPDRHPRKLSPTGSRHLADRGKSNGRGYNGAGSDRDQLLAKCGPELIAEINTEGKDRSKHFASVTWRLFRANFTPEEVVTIVSGTPCAIKYDTADRLVTEVERLFVKWEAKQAEEQETGGGSGGSGGGGGNGTGGGGGGGNGTGGNSGRTEAKDQKDPPPKPGPDSEVKVLQAVEGINADHAFIMSRGGKACVLHEGFDEEGAPKEFYYGINDFHNIMLNRGGLMIGEPEKFVPSRRCGCGIGSGVSIKASSSIRVPRSAMCAAITICGTVLASNRCEVHGR